MLSVKLQVPNASLI